MKNGAIRISPASLGARLPAIFVTAIGAVMALSTALAGSGVMHAAEMTLACDSAARLGTSSALNGNGTVALLGAPGCYTDNQKVEGGAAEVYIRKSATWSAGGELTMGKFKSQLGGFGESVALSADGHTALVGAPFASSNGRLRTGQAFIFTSVQGKWGKPVVLNLGNGAATADNFGWSVALSGDGHTALVGVPGNSASSGFATDGRAEIWTLSGGKWHGPVQLGRPGPVGLSTALNGNGHVAILGTIGPGLPQQSAAEVFTFAKGKWTGPVDVTDKSLPHNDLGASVAINAAGTTALVGDPDQSGKNGTGSVDVFTAKAGKWTKSGQLGLGAQAGKNDNFGTSVSLSNAGTLAIVGTPGRTIKGQSEGDCQTTLCAGAGSADLFTLSNGHWGKAVPLNLGSAGVSDDKLGTSVALSRDGSTAVVGATNRSVSGQDWNVGAGEAYNIP